MKSCSADMKFSALIILMISCASSQIAHEILYVVACFDNGTTEVQYEFDADEVLYADFDKQEVVYSVPRVIVDDPSKIFDNIHLFSNAKKGKRACTAIISLAKAELKNPSENTDPPESILYPSEEVQLGVENSLICFVNHFYPPDIKVSWTRNDRPVSEGVSLSRYYPNKDQTFHQFSTLTFTPREGDIYSCTVEHAALDRPKTRIWEPEFHHQSLGADVYCGVGLTLGLLGVTVGTFLIVKGRQRR